MVIEISLLPQMVQQQILTVEQGQVIEFANHGKIIAQLSKPLPIQKETDSLMAVAGILANSGIDGLAYERQMRDEWIREWEQE